MSTRPSPLDAAELCTARAVRTRAHEVYDYVERGESAHFELRLAQLPEVVDEVERTTRQRYPNLEQIPYHSRFRHFDAGGVDRARGLGELLRDAPETERRLACLDLVVLSVLLDAGAGAEWGYHDSQSGKRLTRSEGLAVASYDWFVSGGASAHASQPLRADAARLRHLSEEELGKAFQVTAKNPLTGLGGRVSLLRRLGDVLGRNTAAWGGLERPGALCEPLLCTARPLTASEVFGAVLEALAPVWPARLVLEGRDLGDTWRHSVLGLVPFHKLSQWLTYSLCEALERGGTEVPGVDALTGLAEYRNGGLFVDLGVIVPKQQSAFSRVHEVASDLVIEWRALTVALLDLTAVELRSRWQMPVEQLPLAKVLEGGTWAAGRRVAFERRKDGSPPIRVNSDGTVF
jgi:hypothetical protein